MQGQHEHCINTGTDLRQRRRRRGPHGDHVHIQLGQSGTGPQLLLQISYRFHQFGRRHHSNVVEVRYFQHCRHAARARLYSDVIEVGHPGRRGFRKRQALELGIVDERGHDRFGKIGAPCGEVRD